MIATAAWAVGSAAWACAGLVHGDDELAESDHAEVVFEVGDGEVSVSYVAGYAGDAASFGWVIPVPGTTAPLVEDGDADLVSTLRAVSAPAIEWGDVDDGGGGCGCLASAGKSDGTPGGRSTSSNGFTVIDEGFTGTFTYTTVAATDAGVLAAWFAEHGWSGLPAEDLQHYVDAGSVFVALTIDPAVATTPIEGSPLPPVRLTYAGDEVRFPSVMARHGLVDQRTTVYVVADGRAVASEGWTAEDGGVIDAPYEDPEYAFLDRLGALGEDRAWLRTWAGPVSVGGADRFATRFDTYAPPEVHDADAVFALEASTAPLSTTIDVSSDEQQAAAGGLAVVALLGWGLRRRR